MLAPCQRLGMNPPISPRVLQGGSSEATTHSRVWSRPWVYSSIILGFYIYKTRRPTPPFLMAGLATSDFLGVGRSCCCKTHLGAAGDGLLHPVEPNWKDTCSGFGHTELTWQPSGHPLHSRFHTSWLWVGSPVCNPPCIAA